MTTQSEVQPDPANPAPLTSPRKGSETWRWQVPQQPSAPPLNSSQSAERADLVILEILQTQAAAAHPLLVNNPVTRNQLQRLMNEGLVTMNGSPLKPNRKLIPGAWIEITFPPPAPTQLVPEDRPLDILYEDEHLLVLNKPPGLTVHPSATQLDGTLVHALLHHIKDLSGIGGKLRPGIVHRIDKDTSGALVITKNDETHLKLSKIFAAHTLERTYWALCYGSPEVSPQEASVKIESLIGRNPNDRKKMSMTVQTGRKAISYYRKIKEFGHPSKKPFASLLEVTLETGRTHQVRVHLAGTGHSILGDPVYGVPTNTQPKWKALPESVKAAIKNIPGQALHARVLGFKHPITGENLRFEATPSDDFTNLLNALLKYSTDAHKLQE